MNKYIYRASAMRGFSLVELMVALLIGIVISIGVVQIFSATRTTYQIDESLARAQENGRFALEFLAQDIRHAGYAGCKRDTSVTIFNNLATPTTPGLPMIGISGAEYSAQPTGYNDTYNLVTSPTNSTTGWTPALTGIAGVPSALAVAATGALPGTDVVVFQRMVPNSWALIDPYITPDHVYIDPAFVDKVEEGDVLLVADCRNAVSFMVTSKLPSGQLSHAAGATTNRCERWTGGLDTANAAAASCAAPFDYDSVTTTAMGKLETVIFYVANDLTADPGNPRPTLFRRVMLATGGVVDTTPLVDGVENFQVLYGVDGVPPFDGAADNYVTANNVSNFARVVSVQIGLLVYGVNATGTVSSDESDLNTHNVAGTSIVPAANSKRTRRVFNTTIQLRNRSF